MREGPFVKTDVAAHGCFLALALAATCALLPFAEDGKAVPGLARLAFGASLVSVRYFEAPTGVAITFSSSDRDMVFDDSSVVGRAATRS